MDKISIVASVAFNDVPYPSWPRVLPPPSSNGFPYSEIKCCQKFAHIFLSTLILLFHLSMYLVYSMPHLESLIIAQLIRFTSISSRPPYGCAIRNIWTFSVVPSINSTGWLQSIGSWRQRRAWSSSYRLGVPYSLLRRSRMTDGLSFLNPFLAMFVFVIPPEWYA